MPAFNLSSTCAAVVAAVGDEGLVVRNRRLVVVAKAFASPLRETDAMRGVSMAGRVIRKSELVYGIRSNGRGAMMQWWGVVCNDCLA